MTAGDVAIANSPALMERRYSFAIILSFSAGSRYKDPV